MKAKKISQQFDQATSGSWYSQDVLYGCVSRTGTALNHRVGGAQPLCFTTKPPGSQEKLGFPDGALYLRSFGRFLSRQPTRLPQHVSKISRIHPGRLTWNIIMEVWKIIFLSKWVIYRFHINLPECNWFFGPALLYLQHPAHI